MNKNNQLLEILKKLISISSWVDDKTNEGKLGDYIYNFLMANSKLTVNKQKVDKNRFNVIAQNRSCPDNLITGHIDTVQPSLSWTKNPIKPEIIGKKLFGLGASDMKSGIAVMLKLATNPRLKGGVAFLFYVDEEYDFKGMRAFVKEYQRKIKPKLIISLDGNDLKINNGCRGLIEISCTIKGKSGHASRPKSGANAILKSYQIMERLSVWLNKFVSAELGQTVYNVAYINGGQYQGEDKNNNLILGKQGNIIPDICQFVLDVRPSSADLTAKKVVGFIENKARQLGVGLENYSIRHDLGSWLTSQSEITKTKKLPRRYGDPGKTGYGDTQMLWEAFNRVPCFDIGAGEPGMSHKPDEYVEINKIEKLEKIISKLIIG